MTNQPLAQQIAQDLTSAFAQTLEAIRIVDLSQEIPDGTLGPSKLQAGVINHTHLMPGVVERHLGYVPANQAEFQRLETLYSEAKLKSTVFEAMQPYLALFHDTSFAEAGLFNADQFLIACIEGLVKALDDQKLHLTDAEQADLLAPFREIALILPKALREAEAQDVLDQITPQVDKVIEVLKAQDSGKLKQAKALTWLKDTVEVLAEKSSFEQALMIPFKKAWIGFLEDKKPFGYGFCEEGTDAPQVSASVLLAKLKNIFSGIIGFRLVALTTVIGLSVTYLPRIYAEYFEIKTKLKSKGKKTIQGKAYDQYEVIKETPILRQYIQKLYEAISPYIKEGLIRQLALVLQGVYEWLGVTVELKTIEKQLEDIFGS